MPTIDLIPYEKRSWYAHLSPDEAQLWDKFITEFPDMYDTVAYDVKIGRPPDFVTEHADPAMRAQAPLYQYKIDVVGYKGSSVDIIELKKYATFRALGQVNSYAHLYKRDIDPLSEPKRIVVTNQLMPEMDVLAEAAGVLMIVV